MSSAIKVNVLMPTSGAIAGIDWLKPTTSELPGPRVTLPRLQLGMNGPPARATLILASITREKPVYSLVRITSKCVVKGRVPSAGTQVIPAEIVPSVISVVLISTETLPPNKFATARSGLPSPSRSPMASEFGPSSVP